MTADEIRAIEFPSTRALMGNRQRFEIQREIAAQIAEQNALMREDLDFRKNAVASERAINEKRDEMLTGLSKAGISAFGRTQELPAPVRVVSPGEIVHLGCIVREPDGTHAIVDSLTGRPIRLEQAEAARLLALMSPPGTEAKPQ